MRMALAGAWRPSHDRLELGAKWCVCFAASGLHALVHTGEVAIEPEQSRLINACEHTFEQLAAVAFQHGDARPDGRSGRGPEPRARGRVRWSSHGRIAPRGTPWCRRGRFPSRSRPASGGSAASRGAVGVCGRSEAEGRSRCSHHSRTVGHMGPMRSSELRQVICVRSAASAARPKRFTGSGRW